MPWRLEFLGHSQQFLGEDILFTALDYCNASQLNFENMPGGHWDGGNGQSAGWHDSNSANHDGSGGWPSEGARGGHSAQQKDNNNPGFALAGNGFLDNNPPFPGRGDDHRRLQEGASYSGGPDSGPSDDKYGEPMNPQDRKERLTVPKPKGV